MCPWVGGVVKLAGDKAVLRFFSQLLGLLDGPLHTLGPFGQDHRSSIRLQKIYPFYAHGLRHGQDYLVSP